jgi:hypothetical protein
MQRQFALMVAGILAALLAGGCGAAPAPAPPAPAIVAAPPAFPADVPQMPDWDVHNKSYDAAGRRFTLRAVTPQPLADVTDFYQKGLEAQGWKQVKGSKVPLMMVTGEYSKGERQVKLSINASDGQGTTISLMASAE